MGVTGLWRLIEPAGKPVPVEILENKVLAVDISIWLHQMVKGYQDSKGAPLPNAHLIGLFQRLCKLLYFKVKPVFVFDGGFPDLKKETIARRQDNRSKYNSESERLKRELALLLSKKTAVSSLLGKQISPKKVNNNSEAHNDDIFKLPSLPQKVQEDSESESDDETSSGSIVDLHSVDIESEKFKTLPVKEKYDLLLELKETRKMNSWGKLHELPKKSDNFSDFQMQRLLKRRKVQECMEETEKVMGDVGMSLNELEYFLNEEGIDTKIESLPSRRIASNNNTRFLLISDVKQALANAKNKTEENNLRSSKSKEEKDLNNVKLGKKDEFEEDLEKAITMSLECVKKADSNETDDSWTSINTNSDLMDSEEEDGFNQSENISSAKSYIMQYTDFTHKEINEIISTTSHKRSKLKVPKVHKILEELQNNKSYNDKTDLSSSDDDCVHDASDEFLSHDIDVQRVAKISATCKNKSAINDATQESISSGAIPEPDNKKHYSSTERDESFSKQADPDLKNIVEGSCLPQNIISNPITSDSSDSDDDFEEVPEIPETKTKKVKTCVQLTLNVGDAPEDDIFADVFSDVKTAMDNIKDIRVAKTNISFKDNAIPGTSRDSFIYCDVKENTVDDKEKRLIEKSVERSTDYKCHNKVTSQLISKVKEEMTDQIDETSVTESNPTIMDEDLEKAVKMSLERYDEPKVGNKTPLKPLSKVQLNLLADELVNQEQDLLQDKGRLDRTGRNITEQMTKEAQELLQLFGIPYIVAPMEAEAQCAFLETVSLTDGTITDDSDIWLFGGRTVYKNFFNQKKHVLQFLAERIERSFNLTREQLILLALLVGSDYTTGVAGVGPVTALEILASFPFNKKQLLNETSNQARYAKVLDGLQEFKKWVRAGKRTDNTTLKKKLRNVELTDEFPSTRVVQAYMEPNIEKSEDKFTWGEIDVTILRDYTKAKFGWSQNKLDEIIKPVLKRIHDRKSQRSVQDFFKRKVEFQSLDEQMSKRVKAAVQKMGPEKPLDEKLDLATEQKTKADVKRKVTKRRIDGDSAASSTKTKQKKINNDDEILKNNIVKVISEIQDGKSSFEISIPKTDRYQEIIPQKEKDKQSLLQNKMKAIELFRKQKIDRKIKPTKKRPNLPKEKADLSETSDSD